MPGVSQIVFAARVLERRDIESKSVIDVGSCDFNGSVRPLLESWGPQSYLGVDIVPGPGVDLVISADELETRFGKESFDVVVCLEMMEHSRHWRKSILNIKSILRPGGLLLLTTRSLGYPCHGWPDDYWRYELEDMRAIFGDFEMLNLEADYMSPGVFLKARKPAAAVPGSDLERIELYSVPLGRRARDLEPGYESDPHCRKLAIKYRLKEAAHRSFLACGRIVSRCLRLR